MEKAVCTLGSITLHDKKIKSNNYQFLCDLPLINILVLFLLRHLNWIDRYSTMKIGRYFFCLSIHVFGIQGCGNSKIIYLPRDTEYWSFVQ